MTVDQGYDQAALDAQLNMRERHPDHIQIFERWADESRRARVSVPCHIDMAYGRTAGQRLDLFPGRGRDYPVLVFIHGGYWQSLDKSDFSWIAPVFAAQGIGVVLLNYDLAPGVSVGEITGQVRQGVAWVHRNIARWGGNSFNMVVAGHSAGGHLAAMVLATGCREEIEYLRGGCLISGLYDLEPVRQSYLNGVLGLKENEAVDLSPLNLTAPTDMGLVCAVGEDETAEFKRQQDRLASGWSGTNLDVCALILPRLNHFTVMDALADPHSPLNNAIYGLLSRGSEDTLALQ